MTLDFRKIRISVSVYFAASVTFALLFSPGGKALLTLLCCILHEAGHLAAIYFSGGGVKSITFGAYGMRIDSFRSLRIPPKKEIIISLAGPLVNIILATAGIILKNDALFKINACLGIFNLLPVYSTDGGTTMYNMLILKTDINKAKAALKIISTAFLIIIYVLGIIVLIGTGYNSTLLAIAVYITIINTTGIRK